MPTPTTEDFDRVNKDQDDAIAELVDLVLHDSGGTGRRYSDAVYDLVWNLVAACDAYGELHNRRSLDEYRAEVERRRQIGLTIDPATAETRFWWADLNDPYHPR